MVSPFGSYLPDSHSETRDNGTERASASLALSPLEDVIARTFLSSSCIFMAVTLRFSDSAVNTWTDLHPTGDLPLARAGHSMVCDPTSGRVILFGGWDGNSSTYLNDTWAYDPIANIWIELHPAGDLPPARESHSMVYDPAGGRVILFGGWDDNRGVEFNDTWAYGPRP